MSDIDLYQFATSLGLSAEELAMEGITPGMTFGVDDLVTEVAPTTVADPTVAPTTNGSIPEGLDDATAIDLLNQQLINGTYVPPTTTAPQPPSAVTPPPVTPPATDTPAGPTTPAAPDPVATVERRDAVGRFVEQMRAWGFDENAITGLTEWIWNEYVNGRSEQETANDFALRPEYRERFKANAELVKGGYAPHSPQDYVELEQRFATIRANSGLPEGFHDSRDDFTALIAKRVSPEQYAGKISRAYQRVADSSPQTKQLFAEWFGPEGPHALAAYILDPDMMQPVAERLVSIASLGGQALARGVPISQALATQAFEIGVTDSQAGQVAFNVQQGRALLSETVNETVDLDEEDAFAAAIGLNDASRELLRRRQAERVAAFGGPQTSTVVTKQGLVGLGVASTSRDA